MDISAFIHVQFLERAADDRADTDDVAGHIRIVRGDVILRIAPVVQSPGAADDKEEENNAKNQRFNPGTVGLTPSIPIPGTIRLFAILRAVVSVRMLTRILASIRRLLFC